MSAEIEFGIRDFTEEKPVNSRAMFYKKPIKKNNYKLEIDDETPQQVRRQRLLQFQKKCRTEMFNIARGILEEALHSDNDDEDCMDVDDNIKQKRYYSCHRNKYYANRLIMSEWMLEAPDDFLEKWIMVPCPQGVRTLVVACQGKTKAYNRKGYRLGTFQSVLPGGNVEENRSCCTLLDCIWMKEQKLYYVLDVLAWSNQPFLNCDTEFRFFWLRSQFNEIKELQERDTNKNKFPFLPLPNIECDSSLELALGNIPLTPPLDGLLFYHRDGHYSKGRTPLVTWLKSFMLPEILGVSVPPPFDEKPDGYIDCRHYIFKDAEKRRSKKASDELMESIDNT